MRLLLGRTSLLRLSSPRALPHLNFFSPLRPSSMSTSAAAPAGIDLSLQRITSLLQRLSSPQDRFPVIHVAGTNAKGSTTAYLDTLLTHAIGLRTGRFNSPHLIEERDACRVGGAPIDAATWAAASQKVEQSDAGASGEGELKCTPFEKLTARALLAFTLLPAERKPEVLLIEVGLGGRLDATNVFPEQGVLASVLCPVDMDHEALLGNTLTAIATEKAAITKPGGLLVVADQRREPLRDLQEMQCEALRGANVEVPQVGSAAGEVLEAVRALAFPLGARVVKSYIPWGALSEAPTSDAAGAAPWATSITLSARHTPSLYASTSNSPSYAGTFSARAGDAIVAGPSLRLPRTRAAITGALTALQTLWAIARDETPGGLGRNGSDPYEDIRLRIAWALRDDRDAADAVRNAVAAAKWEGRGEWRDVLLPTKQKEEEEKMEVDEPQAAEAAQEGALSAVAAPAPAALHLLLDGAHNASAAQALRSYIDACLSARLSSLPPSSGAAVHLRLTFLLSFSKGKDVRAMLSHLLAPPTTTSTEGTSDLSAQLASVSLSGAQVRLSTRVALLEFTTPVEGMPWVSPLPLSDAEAAVREAAPGAEVRSFPEGLESALGWAAEAGDGRSVVEKEDGEREVSLTVLGGSLYLVGDLCRFAQQES